jgi:hypothetical protein
MIHDILDIMCCLIEIGPEDSEIWYFKQISEVPINFT